MPTLVLGMPVDVADEPAALGHLIAIAFDPAASRVSHVIVEPDEAPGTAHLVRSGLMLHEDTRLTLNIARHTFVHEPTIDASAPHADAPDVEPASSADATRRGRHRLTFAMHRHLGASEVVMDSATPVMGADGDVVGSFLGTIFVSPGEQVTHFVITTTRRAQSRDVAVPVAAVTTIDAHRVQLRMTDAAFERLPEHPISRADRRAVEER